jgi:hypothetical protein
MPPARPTTLCLLASLLIAPLLPPSAAQAGTTSATFSVGIRIVSRNTVAASRPAQTPEAKQGGIKSDPSTVAAAKTR